MEAPEGDLERRLTRALRELEAEGVVSAYLFGSYAEARAHRESDVDVGVLLDRRALPGARNRWKRSSRSGLEAISAGSTFRTTSRPSFVSVARYTSPIPPAPMAAGIR
jgi:hypothetical protein